MHAPVALHHLLSIVHSETPGHARRLSLLDVGCGNGMLMGYLHRLLLEYRPGIALDIHGFDVSDSQVQSAGYMDETLARLAREAPSVDWSPRVRLLTSADAWPYADGTFDWVVSNHVLEHVADHEFVLREVARVLRPGGKSVHLFPTRDSLLEDHVHMPFVHWIRDHDRMRGYLRAMSRLGLGNYRQQRREDPTLDLERFAETRADYLTYFTNYVTRSEILRLTKRVGLRGSFRYTESFFFAKLRQGLRLAPVHRVRQSRIPALRALLFFALSRLTSVTLFLEKRQSYRR